MAEKGRPKKATGTKVDPRALQLVNDPDETLDQAMDRITADSTVSAGSVMQAYGSHIVDESI